MIHLNSKYRIFNFFGFSPKILIFQKILRASILKVEGCVIGFWSFSSKTRSLFKKNNENTLRQPYKRGGGQICPPFNYGYWRMFSSSFLARVLFLDVKGQNLKAQPSTSKNVALRALRKICIFGQNLKKFKNRYLEIRLFIGKNAVKIKPRNIGCSSFL